MDAAEYLVQIDQLSYLYDSGNKLLKVTDATNSPDGFKDGTNTGNDYNYDTNGNMLTDQNKNINNITYNYLHLPVEIMIGTGKIQYTYNASGAKLQKKVYTTLTSTLPETTDYLNGYQYVSNVLQFFPTSEGYVKNTVVNGANTFDYIYNYTDHLGNIRVSYTKDPSTNTLKIMEENHYYPFGLKHTYNLPWLKIEYDPTLSSKKIKPSIVKNFYKYKYNGKEYQDELGLNVTAMDFRQYDNALGRFSGIDKLAEMHYEHNPYNFAGSNPIFLSDPTGLDWYYQQGKDGSEVYQWFDGSDEREGWENKGETAFVEFGSNGEHTGSIQFLKDGSFDVISYNNILDANDDTTEHFNFSDHKKQFSNADINTKAGDWSFAKAMKALDDLFNSAASYGTGTNAGASNMGSDVKNWYEAPEFGELLELKPGGGGYTTNNLFTHFLRFWTGLPEQTKNMSDLSTMQVHQIYDLDTINKYKNYQGMGAGLGLQQKDTMGINNKQTDSINDKRFKLWENSN